MTSNEGKKALVRVTTDGVIQNKVGFRFVAGDDTLPVAVTALWNVLLACDMEAYDPKPEIETWDDLVDFADEANDSGWAKVAWDVWTVQGTLGKNALCFLIAQPCDGTFGMNGWVWTAAEDVEALRSKLEAYGLSTSLLRETVPGASILEQDMYDRAV